MPKFRIWFSTPLPPYHSSIVEWSRNTDALHKKWKGVPGFLSIGHTNDTTPPPATQKEHKPDANPL